MQVITFTGSFALMVSSTMVGRTGWAGLLAGAAATTLSATPIMVIQMAALQLVAGEAQGRPGLGSLLLCLLLYTGAAAFHWQRRKLQPGSSLTNWLLNLCLEWSVLALAFTRVQRDNILLQWLSLK